MTTLLHRDDNHVAAGWDYSHITAAAPTTTVIKSGDGMLHAITINEAAGDGVITVYDNTAGSGTVIAIITMPTTLLSDAPHVALYDVKFSTGLTIVTSGAAQDITVSYI